MLSLTASGTSLPEPLTKLLSPDLIRVIAQSVPEFMGYGKIEKLIKANIPLRQQLDLPSRSRDDQNLFEKCLAAFQDAERWAVRIHVNALEDPLPVLGTYQDPRPLP